MSSSIENYAASTGSAALNQQLVEAQMKRVVEKIDKLEMESPPDENEIKEAAAALRRVQSLVDVVA